MFNGHLEECDANPCPWCDKRAKVYLSGSYVEGWYAFVGCSELNNCGARGPGKRTKEMSSGEYELKDQVIELWNAVS